jgi:hypothetical protein
MNVDARTTLPRDCNHLRIDVQPAHGIPPAEMLQVLPGTASDVEQ